MSNKASPTLTERRAAAVMWKPLPLWLFLLCFLLGSLFTTIFGWSVISTANGDTSFGILGNASVAVATFPDLVRSTLSDMSSDRDTPFRVQQPNIDPVKFRPVQMRPDIQVAGLIVRADKAALARATGWRLLVGVFVIDGELQSAVLALSPELQIVKVWTLSEADSRGNKGLSRTLDLVDGFAMLGDGSMIFAFDGGTSLQRIDQCGRRIWSTRGEFNHTVSVEDNGRFLWTLDGWLTQVAIVRVAVADGRIVQRIPMKDIIAANPTIDILEVAKDGERYNAAAGNIGPKWLMSDPFHLNDVEPLPAAFADRFTGFRSGDLLVSSRSLNLLFVMDPTSLIVKWWQSGTWRRQHDPDWQPTGEISLLDNRWGRGYSRIVSVDPVSRNVRVLFDGRNNGFYTQIQGKHQITPNGNILIASPQQGRTFEVESNGHVVFDLFNTKPGSRKFNLLTSEAVWLPLDSFDFYKELSCKKQP